MNPYVLDALSYVARLVFASLLLCAVLFRICVAALLYARGDAERAPNLTLTLTTVFAYLMLATLLTFLPK